MNNILVVEDEKMIRNAIKRLLERNNYFVSIAETVEQAIELSKQQVFDLILSDLRLPGQPGTELINLFDQIPVIIMTSYGSVNSAVESMKLGAIDYITKPFDHDELLILLARTLKHRNLQRENTALKKEIDQQYSVAGMVGQCPSMIDVFKRIEKVARTDTSVLVIGETGTGKELVARAVHAQSNRSEQALISINCAAIAENLVESELFGYEKGAFTGADHDHPGLIEAADGGTLFLDEIGELPLDAQARLLRVLQEKEIRRVGSVKSIKVDIRLIVATHRNLQAMVDENEFRSDLFYRLNVIEIDLPPLRQRSEDIEPLANQLLNKIAKRLGMTKIHFSPEAISQLKSYTWPGNVREMENIIERAIILMDGDVINPEHLSIMGIVSDAQLQLTNEHLSLDDYFIRFVKEHEQDLTETELAKQLGISRKTLWDKRNRLGIPRK